MSEFPRYDRYPAAILADTLHLTLAEKGAYNVLLDTMWLQGARLPNDVKLLGRMVHASNRHWPQMWMNLQGFFTVSADGKWISQKRMTEEFQKAQMRTRTAGKNADKRWGKDANESAPRADYSPLWEVAHLPPNPLTDNTQGDAKALLRARARSQQSSEDQSEALLKGASSDPVASDLPTRTSSAREAERQAAWLHKLAERSRPADPNHPTLLQAEAEQVETYRRARRLREKLKDAGFKGFRIIPP